jgi:hypothetical protein
MDFLKYFIHYCFICRPSDSTVSEEAGIEPRTVATMPLAVRSSDHLARLNIKYPRREITSLPASQRATALWEGGGRACQGIRRQVKQDFSRLKYFNNRAVCHPIPTLSTLADVQFHLYSMNRHQPNQHCIQFSHSISLVLTLICNISILYPCMCCNVLILYSAWGKGERGNSQVNGC